MLHGRPRRGDPRHGIRLVGSGVFHMKDEGDSAVQLLEIVRDIQRVGEFEVHIFTGVLAVTMLRMEGILPDTVKGPAAAGSELVQDDPFLVRLVLGHLAAAHLALHLPVVGEQRIAGFHRSASHLDRQDLPRPGEHGRRVREVGRGEDIVRVHLDDDVSSAGAAAVRGCRGLGIDVHLGDGPFVTRDTVLVCLDDPLETVPLLLQQGVIHNLEGLGRNGSGLDIAIVFNDDGGAFRTLQVYEPIGLDALDGVARRNAATAGNHPRKGR